MLALDSFASSYTPKAIKRVLHTFFRRFFTQQFKRTTLPPGPKVGSVSLSPRGDWRMPDEASATRILKRIDAIRAPAANTKTTRSTPKKKRTRS